MQYYDYDNIYCSQNETYFGITVHRIEIIMGWYDFIKNYR